jgi:hypothetical protein
MAEMDQFRAIGAAGRGQHARDALAPSSGTLGSGSRPAESPKNAGPDPTYTPRTADPAVLEAAERAKAEREALI